MAQQLSLVIVPEERDPVERAAFYERRAAAFINLSISRFRGLVGQGVIRYTHHVNGKAKLFLKTDLLLYLEGLRSSMAVRTAGRAERTESEEPSSSQA